MSDYIKQLLRSPLPTYVSLAGVIHVDQPKALKERAEAADRIEELVEENKELTLQLLATSGQAADALDKLDKAVAALREMHKKSMWLRGEQSYREFARYVEKITRAVLAELEGKE